METGCTVLLVAPTESASASVHFLNGQGQLIRLTDSFTAYLRLMLLYLGLPDWPLVHLKLEPSFWTEVSRPSVQFQTISSSLILLLPLAHLAYYNR